MMHVIIGDVALDASITERHSSRVTVTKHPVEVGADVTDHAREEPDGLAIDGLLSNTPLDANERRAQGPARPGEKGWAGERLERLRALKSARRLVQVITELRTYDNMLLALVDTPVDAHTGDAIRVSLVFEQIVFARNELVRLEQVQLKDATTPTKKEDQGKKPPTEEPDNRSIWSTLSDSTGASRVLGLPRGSGVIVQP